MKGKNLKQKAISFMTKEIENKFADFCPKCGVRRFLLDGEICCPSCDFRKEDSKLEEKE